MHDDRSQIFYYTLNVLMEVGRIGLPYGERSIYDEMLVMAVKGGDTKVNEILGK